MDDTSVQLFKVEPGTKVDGLTVEKQIGEGGMARLFLAHDENARKYVLKVPNRTHGTDPVADVAFENELRLARYLEDFPQAHMPVTKKIGDGHFLMMDYIEGKDLWSYLNENGCFSEAQAIALVKKIVRALADLHRRRIVHLDIKLSNIMITPNGDVRIIDFGLANHLDLPDLIYESFHEPKGTPSYIAPEQFFGVRDEPRSDLFSIGTMLYELTTMKLPYPDVGSKQGVINRIKAEVLSPRQYRPELSEGFAKLVMACLQNLPNRRFESMDALYSALEQLDSAALAAEKRPVSMSSSARSVGNSSLIMRLTDQFLRYAQYPVTDKLGEIKKWIADHKANRTSRYRIIAALEYNEGEEITHLNKEILNHAIRQASLQQSSITILTVLKDRIEGMTPTERERKDLNAACQKIRGILLRIIAKISPEDLPIGINIRTGDTVAAISNCVSDFNANMLIIGTRTRNKLNRYVLGGTAFKVLTNINCLVMVVNAMPSRK